MQKAQSIDEIDDIPIDSSEKRFPQLRDAGCTESVFIEKASQLAWSLPEKEYVSRSSGAPKHDRFLRGRQIAYMSYKHVRATGAHEAVQGLSDLFNIHLQNDDVQDFDVRWDQALMIRETKRLQIRSYKGLYKSKLHDSVQLQTVLASV